MALAIRRAERRKAKLRIGVFGPSGAGKTMSSLKLARGLASDWSKICVIDTENKSADLYSHLGDYNVITLEAPFTPESYIEAIKVAAKAGMEVLIIDSITHEWTGAGGILDLADQLGKDARNSFTVWTKLTPRHNRFIDAILQADMHVICCGRSKQEYTLNQTEKNGKVINVPEKIGMKAMTREGFDYEMTVSFEVPISHLAVSTKDRTGLFQDKPEHIITEETGKKLLAWSDSGADVPIDVLAEKNKIMHNLRRLKIPTLGTREQQAAAVHSAVMALTGMDVTNDQKLPAIVRALEGWSDPEQAFAQMEQYSFEHRDQSQDAPPADTPEKAPANYPPKPWQQQAATAPTVPPAPAAEVESHV